MTIGRRRSSPAPVWASASGQERQPPTATTFREAAQAHALEALEALAWLAKNANSEAVRVSAANAVIDRAHGRPAPGSRVALEDEADEDDGPLEVRWLDPVDP